MPIQGLMDGYHGDEHLKDAIEIECHHCGENFYQLEEEVICEACVREEEQDEVDDVDTFRQQLNQQGEET